MNNNHQIHLKVTCPIEYKSMEVKEGVRFCNSCQKEVMDFSTWSDEEIFGFFENYKQTTCGRFGEEQLAQLNKPSTRFRSKLTTSAAIGILGVSLLSTSCSTNKKAVGHTSSTLYEIVHRLEPTSKDTSIIRGTLVDEQNYPLIGAIVQVNNTDTVVQTGIDGKFELRLASNSIDTLSIRTSYVGRIETHVELKEIENTEVLMKLETSVWIGEVIIIKQPLHKRIWSKVKSVFS